MSKALGNKEFWLAALRTEGAAFRVATASADSTALVPSCPEWTIADLVAHLGMVYNRLLHHVGRGAVTPPDPPPAQGLGPPPGRDVVAWWDDRFRALVRTLDALDPELPAWNWAPQSKTVAFWHRRMAHETTVHRWDAQFAAGGAEPIEAKLALDGVAEVLDTWLPAGRGRGPSTLVGVVALHATDAEHEWFVRLRGEGGVALLDTATLLDTDAHHERVSAWGSASDILLALYGRVGFDVLDVTGDARLLTALRTG